MAPYLNELYTTTMMHMTTQMPMTTRPQTPLLKAQKMYFANIGLALRTFTVTSIGACLLSTYRANTLFVTKTSLASWATHVSRRYWRPTNLARRQCATFVYKRAPLARPFRTFANLDADDFKLVLAL